MELSNRSKPITNRLRYRTERRSHLSRAWTAVGKKSVRERSHQTENTTPSVRHCATSCSPWTVRTHRDPLAGTATRWHSDPRDDERAQENDPPTAFSDGACERPAITSGTCSQPSDRGSNPRSATTLARFEIGQMATRHQDRRESLGFLRFRSRNGAGMHPGTIGPLANHRAGPSCSWVPERYRGA
jgi:hypothetical protein